MAYTYKNEFVNFKLLVNQSVTSNMTIPKNIIDELFKNKNEKVWFAYYVMRGLGRLIMYSQAIHSWKQDKFQASNQKNGNKIIADYFNNIRLIEIKRSFTDLTKDIFENFSFYVIFETLFPFVDRKFYQSLEKIFFDGLEYFIKQGKIVRICNRRIGYPYYRTMYWNITVDIKPIYITDEFADELTVETLNLPNNILNTSYSFKSEWLSQCFKITGVNSMKALRMSRVLCFIINKRIKRYHKKIAYLSFRTLSNLTGFCERSIKNYVKELRDNNLLYYDNYILIANPLKQVCKYSKNFYCLPEDKDYLEKIVEKYRIKKIEAEQSTKAKQSINEMIENFE